MSKPHRQKRISKRSQKRAQAAAQHMPAWMRSIAFSYADNRHKRGSLGTFGAASEVRTIDPSTVDLSSYLEGGNKKPR